MTFTPEQIAALSAKLDGGTVRQREQAGRKFSYIEGWHVIAEANRIFGFDGWDRDTVEIRQLGEPREVDGKWRVAYMAKVRITVRAEQVYLICRDGCGYGSGIDRDLGSSHESALKEAETDAMKRALMTFGNPFGLALYDKTQENVEHAGNGAQRLPHAPAPRPPVPPTTATGATAPKITPQQWGQARLADLAKPMTPGTLETWQKQHRAGLEKLHGTDHALAMKIAEAIDAKWKAPAYAS